MLGWQKYGWMIQAGDKKASAYGTKLVKGVYKDDPQMLNDLAWANLDDDNNDIPADQRDFKFALMAATRANELTKGEDAQILDTLAAAYFKTGDIPKAVSTQEKAVGLIPSGDESKKMNERLKKYRKAAADKKP
jgi:tetratricopeptide (TPR) repeat protein